MSGIVAQKRTFLLVGTYTSGTSEGVHVYDFNTGSGETKLLDVAKVANPSFIAISPNKKRHRAMPDGVCGDRTG